MFENVKDRSHLISWDMARLGYTCWLFSFGSVVGWMLEVLYRSVTHGALYIPGFSFGPYCPIYGFAILLTAYLCDHRNRLVAFGKIFLYSSLLEYGLSWLSETLFGELLWDYSDLPFSIGTRVSLLFSLIWGVLGLIVLTVAAPNLRKLYEKHTEKLRPSSLIAVGIIAADVLVSALARVF